MDAFKSKYVLRASDDGSNFVKIKDIEIKGLNRSVFFDIPVTTAKFYQLEIGELSDIDSYMPFNIAEAELLKANESPLYNPSIPHHLEKAVSVKYEKAEYINVTARADKPAVSSDKVVDLTGKMSRDGELKWDAPPGNWHIIRFGYTSTGANNNPATKEGLGLECDKMNAAAVDLHFRGFPAEACRCGRQVHGKYVQVFAIDSWECGYQNWSESFAGEFEKRRAIVWVHGCRCFAARQWAAVNRVRRFFMISEKPLPNSSSRTTTSTSANCVARPISKCTPKSSMAARLSAPRCPEMQQLRRYAYVRILGRP